MSELTARLATAEDKVTALKGERSRLYQQMAAAADASRNPVGGTLFIHVHSLAVRAGQHSPGPPTTRCNHHSISREQV